MPRTKTPLGRPCPPPDALRAALLGRAPADLLEFLTAHVPGCPACAAAVEEAHTIDEARAAAPLAALREAPLPTRPTDDELADLSSRLAGLVLPPAPATEPPEQIGPYRVKEQLGVGGMGVVYRAEDTALGRDVAIKVLRPGADRDPRYVERFAREARALAAVRHDHVVTVFQVGEAATGDGRAVPFLAMELLHGRTLQDWLRTNPPPPAAVAVRIGRQAAGGLAAAHARGLLHRDVKPANIWLEAPDGWTDGSLDALPAVARVKLIDFGLARMAGDGRTDGRAGTPGYMPPEQVCGAALDTRSDLFALGCVLYELCTGTRAFPADGSFPEPVPIPDAVARSAPRLAALTKRLVALDPAARPATAPEVERELAAAEAEATRTSVVPGGWSRATRRRAAAAGVAACVAAAVVLWPGPGPSPELEPAPPTVVQALPPRPAFPDGPPDDEWCRRAAHRPPKEQFKLVTAKLVELNPGFSAKEASGWIEPELVIRYTLKSNAVNDIRSVRGLPEMKFFGVMGVPPDGGNLTDLSPLTGLPVKYLTLHDQTRLRDLSPLKGCPLFHLDVRNTAVDSLAHVPGELLEELAITGSKIGDLSAVARMPRLRRLECNRCPIASLEPLAGTGLRVLLADIRTNRDLLILKRITHLERVNDVSLAEFYRTFVPSE
ncbi:protein kinase domain-containing protein [Gemmata sp.]|uniref:protein kinase domain-containing protein n=1 Tax=Gemmata sp. TaxID=1914242 RepID=UPI003F6E76F4